MRESSKHDSTARKESGASNSGKSSKRKREELKSEKSEDDIEVMEPPGKIRIGAVEVLGIIFDKKLGTDKCVFMVYSLGKRICDLPILGRINIVNPP